MRSDVTTVADDAAYRDRRLPIAQRVEDLLGRMSIEEKVAQLGSAWVFELLTGSELRAGTIAEKYPDGLGQVTRVVGASDYTGEVAAHVIDQIQRQLVEETRLGIPAIVHEEICSGLMGRGCTVFPQAIGVAATFDPASNQAIADAIRNQMRAMGAHQGLSPVLDVCRDVRWGRTEETYGEDPYLVARMGTAFVDGLQGQDLSTGVIATAKHFVGYGASEGGMNWAPAHIGDRELREVYLHPFEAAVKQHRLASVMNAYHELDGVPCAANHRLLTGVLRDEWGFTGTVVSDYFAIDQLDVYHHVVGEKIEAAALGLSAGIDVELPSSDCFGPPLIAARDRGIVAEETIDGAVRRVLEQKFALGLFESPYVDGVDQPDHAAHTELAMDVAAKSLVLLTNSVLPLQPATGKIAVIGPSADVARNLFGDYSYPAHVESLREMHRTDNVFHIPIPDDFELADAGSTALSVLDAMRERFGDAVTHAKGCATNDLDRSGFDEAVALASEADVVVLVVGDKAGLTEDCTSGETRDRSTLDLPGVQEELAARIIATGTPVITVLVVGRPCGSPFLHANSAAVLVAWLPGQEGGRAIADAIAGAINPGGKLPISFPHSAGQLPQTYAHKVSGGRSHWKGDYVDGPSAPMYPFGFGLSYTSFAFGAATIDRTAAKATETIVVSVPITNTGGRVGDEVIQVYLSNPVASVTRPVLELKSFARITLGPDESRVVRFEIPVAMLGFHDATLDYIVETGRIEILVGSSSVDLISAGFLDIEGSRGIQKAFDGKVVVE